MEITINKVFIAKNIVEYSDEEISGFEYDYTIYDKDEYIMLLAKIKKTSPHYEKN